MKYFLRCLFLLCLSLGLQTYIYAVKSASPAAAPAEAVQQEKLSKKQLRKQRRVERKKVRKALRKQLRQARRESPNRILGFLSFVLSLGSIFLLYLGGTLSMALFSWLGFLLAPGILVISIIALRKIKKNPEKYDGKLMAYAGLVYSLSALLLFLLVILIVLNLE